MAFAIPGFKPGCFNAGADLSTTGRYRFGALSSGAIALAGAGVAAVGVINNKPKLGESVELIVDGVAIVEVGAGGVTQDSAVASAANGLAVNAVATNFILGYALETGVAGQMVSVLLLRNGKL